MVINFTNEIVYHSVLSVVILGHPMGLELCFHGKIVHPIMNALKYSFEEERENCQILQNQSHIFWSSAKPDPIFYHNIAGLSHTYIQSKITTENIYFKNFSYKTFIIRCLRGLHDLSTLTFY